MRPVEIANQPGLLWLPPQHFPSSLTRGGAVDHCEMRKPAKMFGCFLGGLGDDRHVQASAEHASDVFKRHTLIGDPVKPGSRGTLFQRQPEEMGRVEPMHRGPAVESVAHIGRNALFTREADEERDKAVITVAMYRWRKAYHRHAHVTCRNGCGCLFRSYAGNRGSEIGRASCRE